MFSFHTATLIDTCPSFGQLSWLRSQCISVASMDDFYRNVSRCSDVILLYVSIHWFDILDTCWKDDGIILNQIELVYFEMLQELPQYGNLLTDKSLCDALVSVKYEELTNQILTICRMWLSISLGHNVLWLPDDMMAINGLRTDFKQKDIIRIILEHERQRRSIACLENDILFHQQIQEDMAE